MPSVKKQILKITNRKYGLNIQSDALQYLDDILATTDPNELSSAIDTIANAYLKQQGNQQN